MRPLNVVIVNAELPYPPTSGNRIRTLNLTERLARRHHITFMARRNAGGDREADEAAEALRARGIAVQLVDRAVPRKSGLAFYGRLAANLASPLPYSIASHTSSEARRPACTALMPISPTSARCSVLSSSPRSSVSHTSWSRS